jgi:hypothetical protein
MCGVYFVYFANQPVKMVFLAFLGRFVLAGIN